MNVQDFVPKGKHDNEHITDLLNLGRVSKRSVLQIRRDFPSVQGEKRRHSRAMASIFNAEMAGKTRKMQGSDFRNSP